MASYQEFGTGQSLQVHSVSTAFLFNVGKTCNHVMIHGVISTM